MVPDDERSAENLTMSSERTEQDVLVSLKDQNVLNENTGEGYLSSTTCLSPSMSLGSSSSAFLAKVESPAATSTTTVTSRATSASILSSLLPQDQGHSSIPYSGSHRHDQQEDETFYDDRSDADDDLAKGTIKFPQHKLYGREEELLQLEGIVDALYSKRSRSRQEEGKAPTASDSTTADSKPSPSRSLPLPQRQLRIVWISGPCGVGKSALVDQLEKELERSKRRFWMCRAKFRPKILIQRNEQDEEQETQSDFLRESVVKPFSALQQLLSAFQERDDISWKGREDTDSDGDDDDNDEQASEQSPKATPAHGRLSPVADDSWSNHSSVEESIQDNDSMCAHHLLHESSTSQTFQESSSTLLDPERRAFWQSNDAAVLLHVFPMLRKQRNRAVDGSSSPSNSSKTSPSSSQGKEEEAPPAISSGGQPSVPSDLSQLGRALLAMLSVYCHSRRPLILYLDDLQWADVASLEVLDTMLHMSQEEATRKQSPILWIGCYRSEEMESAPRLQKLLDSIQNQQAETTTTLALSTLSPRQITEFLRDTLDLVDVDPLMESIYSRTLGNILYCRHLVEEMARKNILYYDVVCFQWTYVIPEPVASVSESSTAVGRAGAPASPKTDKNAPFLWSKSAIEMVQQKLESLSSKQRRALILAAFIRNIVDVPSLLSCVRSDAYPEMEREELIQLLEDSVEHGLLLRKTRQHSDWLPKKKEAEKTYYVFVHERVQEAAYTLIPPGETRHRLLVQIAQTLLGLASIDFSAPVTSSTSGHGQQRSARLDRQTEWILYVAADHLNRVPSEYWADPYLVAQLNLRVANVSMSKANFDQAVQLLRAGVAAMYSLPGSERVDRPTLSNHRRKQWEEHYSLLLALTNHLIEAESAQGNYAECRAAVEECLANAKSHEDKCVAYFTKVDLAVRQKHGKMYEKGIEDSIKILADLGIRVPVHTTKADLLGEKMRFQIALGTRSLSCIADLPIAEEDWKMGLISQLCLLTNYIGNQDLTSLVALRALRLSLEEGVTKYLPRMLASYGIALRSNGQLQLAYSYAALVNQLYRRFPSERGRGEFSMGQMMLESGIIHIQKPFQDSLETMLSLYWMNVANGNVDMGLYAAMHFPLLFFTSGLPLNALVEPKVILFQDKARQLHRAAFEAIFMAFRQLLRNLQGTSARNAASGDLQLNPVELKGDIMDEDEILSKMEASCQYTTLRDFGIFRLALACIFLDEEGMDAMMLRFSSVPLFDLSIVREHLRLLYQGIASFYLGRKRDDKKLLKTGQEISKKFRKFLDAGSPNVGPVLLCLRALDRRGKIVFDEAISACSESGLIHLGALMNEIHGRGILEQEGDSAEAKEYLIRALWLWTDWGAYAKVGKLKNEFDFLRDVPRPIRSSNPLHSMVLRKASQLRKVERPSASSAPPPLDL